MCEPGSHEMRGTRETDCGTIGSAEPVRLRPRLYQHRRFWTSPTFSAPGKLAPSSRCKSGPGKAVAGCPVGSECCVVDGNAGHEDPMQGATGGGDATVPGYRNPPAIGDNDGRPDSEQPTARRGP
jgi:hypothetical protein